MGLLFYLSYKAGLRVAVVHDPAHRIANNLELALKGAGLWLFVLTMGVVYNLHWGPWGGAGGSTRPRLL